MDARESFATAGGESGIDAKGSPSGSTSTTQPNCQGIKSAAMSPRFEKGEEVYIKTTSPMGKSSLPFWYRGTVIGVSKAYFGSGDGIKTLLPCYEIRYKDSSPKYDEWLFADVLMSYADMANRAIAAEDNQRYKAASTPVYNPRHISMKARESIGPTSARAGAARQSSVSFRPIAAGPGKRRVESSDLKREQDEEQGGIPPHAAARKKATPDKSVEKLPRFAAESGFAPGTVARDSPPVPTPKTSTEKPQVDTAKKIAPARMVVANVPMCLSPDHPIKSTEKCSNVEEAKRPKADAAAETNEWEEPSYFQKALKRTELANEGAEVADDAMHASAVPAEKLIRSKEADDSVTREKTNLAQKEASVISPDGKHPPKAHEDEAGSGSDVEDREDGAVRLSRISDLLSHVQSTASVTIPLPTIFGTSETKKSLTAESVSAGLAPAGPWSTSVPKDSCSFNYDKEEKLQGAELKDKEGERALVHRFLELQTHREEKERQERAELRKCERENWEQERLTYRSHMDSLIKTAGASKKRASGKPPSFFSSMQTSLLN